MVNIKTLLPELRALVADLGEDLLDRVTADHETDARLRTAYLQMKDGGRTAQGYEEWREDYLDQVAVAWVLACVFVRFMEDNNLIDECWIAGEGDRRKLAEGAFELYFRQHPHETDREYLKHVFTEIRKIPAATELFAEGKTPLWAVDPSGDAARRLLEYFREIDPEGGGLKRTFGTRKVSTQPLVDVYQNLAPQARFLGDLYQDLSEHAQKKYALKQTPEFIEQFILDRTLDPAIDEFGLENVRMIDATCGSGHFLLGAFDRLFHEWMKPERGIDNPVVAAQNALDGIFGVDINSFAIAITRFRLLVAAIQACGINKLHQQSYAWRLNLATGDSLLWGSKPTFNNERAPIRHQQNLYEVDPILAVEDATALQEILGQGYHVVVGNPPYITVKDKAQNEKYREIYSTCYRQYSLGVPFTQRFWELAIRKGERIKERAEESSPGAGHVGMITANSFMKREFGKKVIEEFLPKVDLTHVIDTSGAYIPGHGTDTVVLFGRSRRPVSATIRAIRRLKGEPGTPKDPPQGQYWQSIVKKIDIADAQDEFTSSADVPRTMFSSHPWSIGGGGTAELKEQLDSACEHNLEDVIAEIGFGAVTREDEVYLVSKVVAQRHSIPHEFIRPLVSGDEIRDWVISSPAEALFPYDPTTLKAKQVPEVEKFLWPWKNQLSIRVAYGQTQLQRGLKWFEYSMLFANRLRRSLCIAFASISTHNHCVLNRSTRVFKDTSPVILLSHVASEEEHQALLGLLNSSTVCFYLRQVCMPKGGHGIGRGIQDELWEVRYAFNTTQISAIPVPESKPLPLGRQLDVLGLAYARSLPECVVSAAPPTFERLATARTESGAIRRRMIALQEELDWRFYQSYGLTEEDLCSSDDDLPELALGQRAFEILMARQMAEGELQTAWFERHGSTAITEIPAHWPAAYRTLVERRIEVIQTNKEIGLIERPEYKRRWNTESWETQERRALKNWLLDRLESPRYWPSIELQSTARLADRASGDGGFMQVAALYRGRPDFDVVGLVAELVEGESVPFLPILRYKPTGLRKRAVWEWTWVLQRKQDAGEDVGEIPVPPKYASTDFQSNDFWRLRGKLDVPKERWICYPHLQTDSDPSLVVGWAGWDHLQQATALVAYYDARKREGWDARRLTPILAGLDQLLPWIRQWHPEIDPEFGDTAGQSYQALLENDAHELGLTLDDIRNWQPPEKPRKARSPRKQKAPAEADE